MFANAMEVFKLLEKSNCKKCNEPTCLAFASKVFLGQKTLDLCPCLEEKILLKYADGQKKNRPNELEQEKQLVGLKNMLKECDLKDAARRTMGKFDKGRLTIKIFGKPFSMDNSGRLMSDIHINPWISMPVLDYVLHSKGNPLVHEWVPFRELEKGREMNSLFVQRVEKPLKKIADNYPGLFEDLMLIFSGKQIENHYESDISLVLYPLPLLPLLICYWQPEDGMESDLNIFFDVSASANAGIGTIYGLCTGIVRMFEKMSHTHGWQEAGLHN